MVHKLERFLTLKTIALFLLLTFLSACGDGNGDLHRRTQILMGTLVEIIISERTPEQSNDASSKAFDEMQRIENLFSSHLPDSEISRINQNAGGDWVAISKETQEVLKRALYWSQKSEGAFDPTIGAAAALWNLEEIPKALPSPGTLEEAASLIDYRKLELKDGKARLTAKGMSLHLGAIGKGYAVDRAIEALKEAGVEAALVNAGGDLAVFGKRKGQPWRIGLQHPRHPEKMIAALSLENQSMATSGDYQKYFMFEGKRYHHILNPKTGSPATEASIVSATVITKSVMDADALATALFVMGPQKGIELANALDSAEAMIITEGGTTFFSENFKYQPDFIYRGFEAGNVH